jgi:hypothetical protein
LPFILIRYYFNDLLYIADCTIISIIPFGITMKGEIDRKEGIFSTRIFFQEVKRSSFFTVAMKAESQPGPASKAYIADLRTLI